MPPEGTTGDWFWWGGGVSYNPEAAKYANVADDCARRAGRWKTCFNTNDGYVASSPVGRFLPNPFGLYDIIGNVEEWCGDWYSETYYQQTPQDAPQGPPSGTTKAIRGGSYVSFPGNSRQTFRDRLGPGDNRYHNIGFRVVYQP